MKRANGDGSIYLTKDGRWTARVQLGKTNNGKPKIKAFYGKTKTEVTRKLREFQKQDFLSTESSKQSFSEYLHNWLVLYKERSLRATSFDRLEGIVQHVVEPYFKYINLSQVSCDHIQKFFMELQDKGYAYATLEKIKHLLNGCFKHALARNDIRRNPMVELIMPSKETFVCKEIVFLNEEDIGKFTRSATEKYLSGEPVYRYGYGLVFMMYTGLRLGEALALKKSDIDCENKTVTVNKNTVIIKNRHDEGNNYIVKTHKPKTKTGVRTVYLCQTALNALEELCKITNIVDNDSFIFSTTTGKAASKRNIQRTVQSIASKSQLSIPYCNVHTLRHTFASMLFRKKIDVKTISVLLGHSNVNFTYNRYIHLLEEQKHLAVALLDSL